MCKCSPTNEEPPKGGKDEIPDQETWNLRGGCDDDRDAVVYVSHVCSGTGLGDSELAKQSQNPVANLISIPFQNNINFGLEPNHRTQNVLNIHPVIPFHLTDDWNLITPTIMPVIKQPDVHTTSDDTWGIGDINTSLFLSPAKSSGLI